MKTTKSHFYHFYVSMNEGKMIGKLIPMRIMHIKKFSFFLNMYYKKEYHLNSTDYEKQMKKAIYNSKIVMSLK